LETETELIFVSLAAYRDPQLVPTIDDCLRKASHPERLRFGICFQHGPESSELPFDNDDRFRILDVPWRESQGACWARAEIMKLWHGEPWFMQVDSHCRFAEHWDTRLIAMARGTGSGKPILSTYAAAFEPGPKEVLAGAPLQMALQGFTAEGIPHMRPLEIRDCSSLHRPLRARFLSAGFLFAPGHFVEEVPYDPELYFLGEEIAMTLRAFTCGYDLFHPHEQFVWHDYVRRDAVKHWDDHTEPAGKVPRWNERDAQSKARVKKLLAGELTGPYGLGQVKTLPQYEEYAGISLRLRKAQDYTSRSEEPPNPPIDSSWAEEIYSWLIRIRLKQSDFSVKDRDEFSMWSIGVRDRHGNEMYRRDLSRTEIEGLPFDQAEFVLICELQSGCIPTAWTVWPVSQTLGWLRKIEGKFADDDFAIVLEEE
jgi:hypothetical protein